MCRAAANESATRRSHPLHPDAAPDRAGLLLSAAVLPAGKHWLIHTRCGAGIGLYFLRSGRPWQSDRRPVRYAVQQPAVERTVPQRQDFSTGYA